MRAFYFCLLCSDLNLTYVNDSPQKHRFPSSFYLIHVDSIYGVFAFNPNPTDLHESPEKASLPLSSPSSPSTNVIPPSFEVSGILW